MTASWHVVAKLLTVSRMSKVDYQNKVLPVFALEGVLWTSSLWSFNQELSLFCMMLRNFWKHISIGLYTYNSASPIQPYTIQYL